MSVDSSLGSSNGGRPLKPVRKYGIPRYRVTLVREGRAIPAAESVHTSEGAAAILRPLFAGLDREQFRGGSGWLDSLGHSLSGAWRVADYAAVSRVVRLSEYTWSGVLPSSA